MWGAGRRGGKALQNRPARAGEFVGEVEHHAPGRGEPRAAAVRAPDHLFDERRPGEVRERVDRLPGGLVAHPGAPRRFGDGSDVGDATQNVHAFVGLFGENPGEKLRVGGAVGHVVWLHGSRKNHPRGG